MYLTWPYRSSGAMWEPCDEPVEISMLSRPSRRCWWPGHGAWTSCCRSPEAPRQPPGNTRGGSPPSPRWSPPFPPWRRGRARAREAAPHPASTGRPRASRRRALRWAVPWAGRRLSPSPSTLRSRPADRRRRCHHASRSLRSLHGRVCSADTAAFVRADSVPASGTRQGGPAHPDPLSQPLPVI